MKKLLSVTLAVAMIVSLFCVVPASATMVGSTGVYVFEDFESGTSSVTVGAANGSLEVLDTDNGSAKAVKYTFSNDVQYPDLNVIGNYNLKDGFTEDMTLRGSVKYKLGTALSSGSLTLLTVNSGDSSYYSEWKIPNLTDTTNWYTAEFEIPNFAKDANSIMFQLRVGNSGAKCTQSADGENVEIYLDDLQISREKNTNKEVLNFSANGAVNYLDINAGSKSIVNDPLNSNNKVLKLTPSSNGDLYNVFYFRYLDNEVTYKVGDRITVTLDVLVEGMQNDYLHNLQFRYYIRSTDGTKIASAATSGYYAKPYLGSNAGQWQTITWTFDVTDLGNGQLYPYLYLTDNTNNIPDDGNKKVDMGYYTYYLDNLTIKVSDRSGYTVPTATGLTATMADGVVTPSYTYAETAVTGVEAGTDASLLKVKRANGAVVASAVAGGALVVPEAYRNESLTLEVLPVSSRGLFGDAVVTAAITGATPAITATAIEVDGANIKVSAAADITNAKLIFVKYENDKMVANDMTTAVTVAAQATATYAIPEGYTTGDVKVMLWADNATTFAPLADAIN